MMHRILEMISRGGIPFDRMADELGITNSMLAAKLQMLRRMGYIDDITDCSGNDAGSCSGCPSASSCMGKDRSSAGSLRIFILTDKGRGVLNMDGSETS